jgi:hypothetical protein
VIEIYWEGVQFRILETLGAEIPVGLFSDYRDYKNARDQLYAEMMNWA